MDRRDNFDGLSVQSKFARQYASPEIQFLMDFCYLAGFDLAVGGVKPAETDSS